MELIKLAFLTDDIEYGKALARAIVRNTKGMEIWVYDRCHLLEDEITRERFDILMADSNIDESIGLPWDVKFVERYGDENPEEGRIYRYGNVRVMADHLYLIYTIKTGRSVISDASHDCSIFSFVAERGGAGCTKAALEYGEMQVGVYGKRTLLISLEQFPDSWLSEDYFTEISHKRNLKQLLYQIICRKDKARHTPMMSYVSKDSRGVYHFNYPQGPNPLLQLYEEGFMEFMAAVLGDGAWDSIIIDCSSQLSMQMIRSMEMSQRIFIVLDHRRANSGWRRCLEGLIDEKTANNIVPVGGKYDRINI